jgi:hypothetical protein
MAGKHLAAAEIAQVIVPIHAMDLCVYVSWPPTTYTGSLSPRSGTRCFAGSVTEGARRHCLCSFEPRQLTITPQYLPACSAACSRARLTHKHGVDCQSMRTFKLHRDPTIDSNSLHALHRHTRVRYRSRLQFRSLP